MVNSNMKFKTNSKKLQFGSKKCKKIYVGKYCEDFKCQNLTVDNCEEIEVNKDDTQTVSIEDFCNGEVYMEEKDDEKYLGDIVSNDGRNIKHIKTRGNKRDRNCDKDYDFA